MGKECLNDTCKSGLRANIGFDFCQDCEDELSDEDKKNWRAKPGLDDIFEDCEEELADEDKKYWRERSGRDDRGLRGVNDIVNTASAAASSSGKDTGQTDCEAATLTIGNKIELIRHHLGLGEALTMIEVIREA